MESLNLLATYITIGETSFAQTLITAIGTTVVFAFLAVFYARCKRHHKKNIFVFCLEFLIESVQEFIHETWPHLPRYAKSIALFVFVYIARNNLLGVFGDMFSMVIPRLHHYFRPATTDVFFNAILAVMVVWATIFYGIQHTGVGYLTKYFPIHGLGIVPRVHSIVTFFAKIGDIIIWFLVGGIELIGEFAKMISLSLRLLGNIFAGMVLLGLWIAGGQAIMHAISPLDVPFLLPLLPFALELCVGVLQAFIFMLLTLVYFKIAGESHSHS